ncbi:hypothetical protein [Streptomyces sp. NPDC006668]|uniref:hypothetical protein n=1 Tax=Streptomyces sp. NPDC006668 TaxID=3156903 RepID=UPI00340E86F6
MTWWLRTRRPALLAIVTAGFWAVALAVGNSSLPLPQLGGATSADVPLILFAPLAPAIALNTCYGTPASVETTAVRRVAALDTLLAVTVLAATLLITAPVAAGWINGADASIAEMTVRNLACYTGLALIGRTALGNHASTIVPTLLALIVSIFGYGPEQTAHWWAWPAATASDVLSWAGSTVLLIIGLYCTARRDFPRRA